MQLLNSVIAIRMLTMTAGESNGGVTAEGIPFGSVTWFLYAGLSCLSLGLVDLEILQRSGTSSEKKQPGFGLGVGT